MIGRFPLELIQQVGGVLLELALEDVGKVRFDQIENIFQRLMSGFPVQIPVDDAELLLDDLSVLITTSRLHELR